MMEKMKENLRNLNDEEKIEMRNYLNDLLKEYDISVLKNKLTYADDLERVKYIKELKRLEEKYEDIY